MTYEKCPSCGTAIGDGWCRACDAESDRINRPEAGAVPKPSARDWTEDFGHENGNYESICWRCGDTFIGHKRRVACKVCASSATQDTDRLCTEIAETAGAIEATEEERTPLPDVAGYAELLARIPEGFTEGPWWTAAKYDGREMGCAVIAVRTGPLPGNPTRGMVAFSSAVLNTEARRCEADARLIALAPELADALRSVPAAILAYLYAEAGVRLNELGAGEPLRIAYATLRKDIRAMAERFGVELEG
jgi:hypothetical protein